MSSKSLTRNSVMHGIHQLSGLLLPLVVFPYISRVLLPAGVGRVQFATSVAGLFAIAAALGIPVYGVRETARVRDNPVGLTRLVAELFLLNAAMTLLALCAFVLFCLFSETVQSDPLLFWICSIPLLMVPFGLDYLFQGLEEFSWIALRALGLRLLLVAGIFWFVRDVSDYRVYALLMGVNIAGSAVMNCGFALRRLDVKQLVWRELNVFRHIRPAVLMFALWAVVGIYTSLDKVMLGYLSDEAQVGFYTVGDKIVRVATGLVSALGMVLFPRLSYCLERKEIVEYGRLCGLFLRILLFLCIPASVGLIVVADPLIALFAGGEFYPSVLPLRLMGGNVVMLALSGFLGLQVFYPQGREKLVLYSVLAGAAVNMLLNSLLIPRLQAAGAAVATLAAESLVVVLMLILSKPLQHFIWPVRAIVFYGVTALGMAAAILLLLPLFSSAMVQLAVCISAGGLLYVGCMAAVKDEVVLFFFEKTKGVLGRR